ncbi:unnamed protein product [Pocillopora meandrina]|uniref:DOMON domain-containing protein n=1 Tax=Pocillopora meandrina TaxID=46732 RepID=A0AAU9VLI1_9CNID|nr:unnamed protein product [Pocillopora meandrina]
MSAFCQMQKITKVSACCLLIFVCLAKSSIIDLTSGHSFFAALDESQKVKLYWNVDTAKKEISFTVEAQTTGWVGFGISTGQGKMQGADIVIGWVKDGKTYFKDRHATGYSTPKIDSQQDYVLIALQEESGKTVMKFKRKFETCDTDDNSIKEGTTKVIYAMHPEDPESEDNIPMHTIRGARSVFLLNAIKDVPKLPADAKTFSFLMNKTQLPPKRTTYYYRVFQFPTLPERRDVIRIEPVIQEGNEGIVHHILLYQCDHNNFPSSNLSYEGVGNSPDMPPAVKSCTGPSTIAAWAIGGETFYFPEHVGFSIGTNDSPKIVVMEMHYDNPLQKTGILDSSGLRFHYTSQVREYQAGILTVGWLVSKNMIIPPHQESWETQGYCVEDCTKEGMKGSSLSGGGIKIFASALHTHLAGHAAYTKHVRDGVELPEIIRDDNYDFNFQEFQIPAEETTVMPGDTLITGCKYHTKDHPKSGGLGTTEEMCLSFHYYYPKINLSNCLSCQCPAVQNWYQSHYSQHPAKNNSLWNDKWTPGLRASYRDTNAINAHCSGVDGKDLPGLGWKVVDKPKIDTPLKPEPVCQDVPSSSPNKLASYSLGLVTILFAVLLSCIY